MKELLKTLLIFGGGGLAVWYFMRGREGAATTTSTAVTAPPPSATKDLIRAASVKGGYPSDALLNHDQWNWFYRQVRGADGPAWENVFADRDRGYLFTLDEWWAVVSQHGLSGVRPWRDPAFSAWGIRC
jgi:hypothetical protein